jgi:hypothetical protein
LIFRIPTSSITPFAHVDAGRASTALRTIPTPGRPA